MLASNAFVAGHTYEIRNFRCKFWANSDGKCNCDNMLILNDAAIIGRASASMAAMYKVIQLVTKFTVDADATVAELAHLNALTEGMTFRSQQRTL